MQSSHSLNSKKQISNYVLIPFALVQSEIYWLCSVIYYIFKHSLDVLEEQQDLDNKKRRRANSAPTRSLSAPASPVEQQQSIHSVTFADNHKIESYNDTLPTKSLRRKSLPDINIRHRPSVHDERKGTTCPPLWWQKTRVKLGHTPVHGDPKPIMTTIMLDNQQRVALESINSTSADQAAATPFPSPTSSSTTAVSSPSSSARPSLEHVRSDSSSSSIQSQESNTTNKQRDDTNASTSSRKGSKFISKISTRFHKHSRSRG